MDTKVRTIDFKVFEKLQRVSTRAVGETQFQLINGIDFEGYDYAMYVPTDTPPPVRFDDKFLFGGIIDTAALQRMMISHLVRHYLADQPYSMPWFPYFRSKPGSVRGTALELLLNFVDQHLEDSMHHIGAWKNSVKLAYFQAMGIRTRGPRISEGVWEYHGIPGSEKWEDIYGPLSRYLDIENPTEQNYGLRKAYLPKEKNNVNEDSRG